MKEKTFQDKVEDIIKRVTIDGISDESEENKTLQLITEIDEMEEDEDIITKVCDEIRSIESDKKNWNNNQIVVLDLIKIIYSSISDKYLINKSTNEKAIRGLLCAALSLFFGHKTEEWENVVDEKFLLAKKQRAIGNNNRYENNEIPIEDIASIIREAEVPLLKELHQRYGVVMPKFSLEYIRRKNKQ